MVNTTYLVTKALEIGNAAKSAKSSSREDGDDFRSMLDKSTKKTEQDAPKSDAATEKAETKPESGKAEAQEESKAPEMQEGEGAPEENAALEAMVQQCAMANEQKLTLNWAEAPTQQDSEPVQTTGIAAGEQQLTAEAKPTQTAAQTATQAEAPKAEQPVMQEAAMQTQENQPKQEQQTEVSLTMEGKAEAKEGQNAVQKGAESQTAEDGGKTDLNEQKTTDAADSAAAQKAVPKEENLVQVKVGETVKLADPKAAEQLADSVLVKAQENTNEYELQLNPQELGKIKIKLVLEEGRIHVSMFCENQKAADLLGLTSSRLRGILEERTGSEAYVEVQKEDTNPYSEQEREKEQHGRGYEGSGKQQKQDADAADFMQQLRLGLVEVN